MRKTVKEGVDLAFAELGEFTKKVTLKKVKAEFNFNSGLPEEDAEDLIVNAFVLNTIKNGINENSSGVSAKTKVIVKTAEIDNLTFYDRIEIDGEEFRIGGLISRNDFVTIFNYCE